VSAASVRERVAWDRIRYASVWEDADVLCDALGPVAPGGRLLSIASAGDNALALLTLDPAEVVAVDLNPAQLACVELRIAAFRQLDDAALLGFLGVSPDSARPATYRRLRGDLTADARAFWDAKPEAVRGGIIHAGRFERYLRGFRRWVLPLVHSPRTMRALRESRTLDEQRAFYGAHWNTLRWRLLFRLFFSRTLMGRLGRDPAFFTHVEGSVAERLLDRTRHALTEVPVRPNPYLAYIMTGTFPPEALPRYLRPEHREAIRTRLDRVRLVRGGVEDAGSGWDGFNLSDIWEYMTVPEYTAAYRRLVDGARPGARLVYWNLLAPRACPSGECERVRSLSALAEELHARDRAWFYGALQLDEVLG
jgi:S-adenosylmethionine-diacylglycerol 3-amino-3-carboxypropyl transferase